MESLLPGEFSLSVKVSRDTHQTIFLKEADSNPFGEPYILSNKGKNLGNA